MNRKIIATVSLLAFSLGAGASASPESASGLSLSSLQRLGTVDERYQGYNIEMVEVTGGRFWAPYGGPADERYRQRAPLDLTDPRLIAIARQLAPAYMRVSGTWANNTYLEAEGEKLTAIPAGYRQVLTRQQWRNVIAFSKAADAPIVTSFAVSGGTRAANGWWTTDQAQRMIDLTRDAGGSLYAAEFFNEPNIPSAAEGMPKGYDQVNYAAEFRIFRDWAKIAAPQMKIIGPGGAGEGTITKSLPGLLGGAHISSDDMMRLNPGSLDAVSYHFYGSVSQRCTALGIGTAVKEDALKPEWLDRTLLDFDYYSALRDKYEPGKPLWNTETAQAACGGSPWASTFLDSFRYLNQNAVLAQKGVQAVMHNTLATSDYALIDRETMTPRPNYWAAVLWRRVMGQTVLASPQSPSPELRLYAHCLRGKPGGVGVLALNTGATAQTLSVPSGQAWVMTGMPIDTRTIKVNGVVPVIDAKGSVTGLGGRSFKAKLTLSGQSIAFVAVPGAANPACK